VTLLTFFIVSGQVPKEPVVSTKTGHLFEKELILKFLQENEGLDPFTKQPLSVDDLIPVVCMFNIMLQQFTKA
jgi:pre-mRNA-processing factor 19